MKKKMLILGIMVTVGVLLLAMWVISWIDGESDYDWDWPGDKPSDSYDDRPHEGHAHP